VVGVVNSEVNKLGVIYGVFIGNFWVGYIRWLFDLSQFSSPNNNHSLVYKSV
jgi:hypothetical protein